MTKDEFKNMLEDYAPNDDMFSDEPELISDLKDIVYNKLDEVDKRCILLYAELGTYRKLAKELGVSVSSSFFKIRDIRKKIYKLLNA